LRAAKFKGLTGRDETSPADAAQASVFGVDVAALADSI
jgi:hypothetical protein